MGYALLKKPFYKVKWPRVYSLFQISIYPHFYKSKSLFFRNHSKYQNMQYTIEKPYKMVTKNDRNFLKFSTFVRFLGPFLKKQCFSKIGNFERDEKFWMKLSAKFPHKVLWKMNTKWVGMTPIWYLLHPFFKNAAFSKIALKT